MSTPPMEVLLFNELSGRLRYLTDPEPVIEMDEGYVGGHITDPPDLRMPVVIRWQERPPTVTAVTLIPNQTVTAQIMRFAIERETLSVLGGATAQSLDILEAPVEEQYRLATDGVQLEPVKHPVRELLAFANEMDGFEPYAG